jgi:hypothetical protein
MLQITEIKVKTFFLPWFPKMFGYFFQIPRIKVFWYKFTKRFEYNLTNWLLILYSKWKNLNLCSKIWSICRNIICMSSATNITLYVC